jgi:hypothetical protein
MKEPVRRKLNEESVENKNVKPIPMPALTTGPIDIYCGMNNETNKESDKTEL